GWEAAEPRRLWQAEQMITGSRATRDEYEASAMRWLAPSERKDFAGVSGNSASEIDAAEELCHLVGRSLHAGAPEDAAYATVRGSDIFRSAVIDVLRGAALAGPDS